MKKSLAVLTMLLMASAPVLAQEGGSQAEAQMIDAVRNQIDTLYTYYVDNVAARVTLRFSQAYVKGLAALLDIRVPVSIAKQNVFTFSSPFQADRMPYVFTPEYVE